MVFVGDISDISIVHGVYKPIYNVWGHHLVDISWYIPIVMGVRWIYLLNSG